MASPRYLTVIPTTQPSCGSITLNSLAPQCNTSSNANEAMGCFVQSTGLYCAPLATTRGFLYTLDDTLSNNNGTTVSNNTISSGNSTSNGYSGVTSSHSNLIPRLSTATLNTNNSNTTLGVDGQPVLFQAAAGLGQTCVGIPVPPEWDILVAMAEKRLKEIVESPGLGSSGTDILSLRGDCEAGTYCDFSQSSKSPQDPTLRLGTCKEQLPNYHTCSSYFECISLRCDDMTIAPRRISETSDNHMRKRKAGAVCLPPKQSTVGTGDGNSGETTQSSFFPMWAIIPIAIVAIGGAALMYVLVRRRRQHQEAQQKNGGGPKAERMRERERERTTSSNSFLYRTPTATSMRASSSSNHSRVILPKITTTFTDQPTMGPSTPTTSNKYSASSTLSTASSPTRSSSVFSVFSNPSVPPSPSSPSRRQYQSSLRSSGFSFPSDVDRFQEGEIPSRSLLRVSSMGRNLAMPPSATDASGGAGLTRAISGNSTLIPVPSPTSSWSSSSSAPLSPTIPISPISPISPPPPYLGTNCGGSSRLASRSSYQIAGASHRRS
ncbi:hypothetical protein EDD21DRAFT_380972 [Dissophora ornata]|nr:hypothetical protein EDD21DRAFT_380972 [Dissophora ornata]